MKLAIMQPTFNPWIGYFDLIDSVDTFVFLDNVQLEKRSWQVRNKIKSNNLELLISIPIIKTASRDNTLLCNAEVSSDKWTEKILKTIRYSYSKSMYYEDIYPFISDLVNDKNDKVLSKYNTNIIETISNKIGIETNFINASKLANLSGIKDDLLLSICKELKCEEYISPQGSSKYLIENNSGLKYEKENIDLFYTNYEHPNYTQLGKSFISHIGILDLLFNEGFLNSLEIIRSGRKDNINYKDFDFENR
jgi:hypothetical protein